MFQSTTRMIPLAAIAMMFSLTTAKMANAAEPLSKRSVSVTTWEIQQVTEAIWITIEEAESGLRQEQRTIIRLIRVPVTKTFEVDGLPGCDVELPQFSPLLRRLGWGDQNLAVELC